MTGLKYTYDSYRSLLERLIDEGRDFQGFDVPVSNGDVLLRHDVDWSPEASLRMAEIESELEVQATYFVLTTGSFYNAFEPSILSTTERIDELGHDVGLHFDANAYFDDEPESERLRNAMSAERETLQKRLPNLIDTVAFHNPDDWCLGRTFAGISHTYEPAVFDQIGYRSDSLGRWRDERPLGSNIPETLQLLVHPTLWSEEDTDPEVRIRQAQREALSRMDRSMRTSSRLDWTNAKLK